MLFPVMNYIVHQILIVHLHAMFMWVRIKQQKLDSAYPVLIKEVSI